MKTALLAIAAVAALSGAALAAGERPEIENNPTVNRGWRPDRYDPPRYPRGYEGETRNYPGWGVRPALGDTCSTPRYACELSRPRPLGEDCWCRSPSGARRSGVVTR